MRGLICYDDVKDCQESQSQRCFDAVVAFCGLLFFLPIIIGLSLAIMLEDGRPVFYTQTRVGLRGRLFALYKFRSMVKDAERATGPVLSFTKDPRITRVGHWMRATALDELPQLWNILKGDMSFVGPRSERPCFVKEFEKTIPNYSLRFHVRPGLTGIAQIYGRYNTTARNKLRYDVITLRHQGLKQTLKLIAISFGITFRGKWTAEGKNR